MTPGETPWAAGNANFLPCDGIVELESRIRALAPDIIHVHGLWRPHLHKVCVIARHLCIPYVISPRGMLEPWSLAQKRLKKTVARWLYQDKDLKCAAALHATAESEAEQLRKLGFVNPIIISPNGVNVPKSDAAANHDKTSRRVLFASRMHPKKGVMELVEAWNVVKPKGWVCELVYTVNDGFECEYEERVKAKVRALGLDGCFIFTGALDDEEKWKAYGRADIFVLPTYSENFGIVVAEALWARVPVITTKGTPWHDLEDNKCGWWIEIGVEPLVKALSEVMRVSDAERCEMGERGRRLVEEKYTWNAVVKTMLEGYGRIARSK